MRLIDADELRHHKFLTPDAVEVKKWLPKETKTYQQGWNDAIDAIIDNAPTVEQECYITGAQWNEFMKEHKRPQGEWIIDGHHYKCSLCGKTLAIMFSETDDDLIGCPFCGADMRKEADNE